MDGFKNSTKTHYMKGGSCDAYAKGGKVKGAAKISKVMGEFKAGTLHSGSKKGPEVSNPKQAVAIALSEARQAGAKIPKKANGGLMREGVSTRPVTATGRRMSMEEMSTPDNVRAGAKRAERMQGMEAREEAKLMREARESRKVGPKVREAVSERRTMEQRETRTPLDRRLSTLPSKAEMQMARRGPAGAGFSVEPLVNSVRGALGLKKGGLATMPRGKKC